jgi:hypothetical protein
VTAANIESTERGRDLMRLYYLGNNDAMRAYVKDLIVELERLNDQVSQLQGANTAHAQEKQTAVARLDNIRTALAIAAKVDANCKCTTCVVVAGALALLEGPFNG